MKAQDIFVFGSNLAGRHGAGAAKYALQKYGAVYGQGIGRQGHSYAIPTKDAHLNTLPLSDIRGHIEDFSRYAAEHHEEAFVLTPIGCGLAGYKVPQIWSLLNQVGLPYNVTLHPSWVNDHSLT